MGTPTTWHECTLSPAALERNELMVGNGANRIRAELVHSILSTGTRRILTSCWWRERRSALMQFAPCPTINSVHSIACVLRNTSRRVFRVQMEIHL
jgi:hypothetical protein